MKAETFLERIEKKPVKKLSNNDAMVLLLYDLKVILEQQVTLLEKLTSEVESSGDSRDSLKWWQKIFS
jgi:hypothetical protein